MRAAVHERYGPPSVVQIKEVATPTPGDGEYLVRIHAAVVSSATATFRKGANYSARLFTGLRKPKTTTLGDVMAGEIVAAGKNATRFRIGERVFGSAGPGMGAHAEYINVPADAALVTMPDNLSYEDAAGIADGALTALPFLRDAGGIDRGQKVLINGASGAIGTIAVQLAKHFGAEVTGVCSGKNVELVKSLGADHVIDYGREDFTNSGERYDIIFDTVGKSSFGRSSRALKPDGIYLTTVVTPGILLQSARTSLFGSKKARIIFAGLRKPAEQTKDLAFLSELVATGALHAVVDRTFPLDQIADAHALVDTGHKRGNVVVTMI